MRKLITLLAAAAALAVPVSAAGSGGVVYHFDTSTGGTDVIQLQRTGSNVSQWFYPLLNHAMPQFDNRPRIAFGPWPNHAQGICSISQLGSLYHHHISFCGNYDFPGVNCGSTTIWSACATQRVWFTNNASHTAACLVQAKSGANVPYTSYGAERAVATHELGHCFGLGHRPAGTASAMAERIENISTQSSLDGQDLADLDNLYNHCDTCVQPSPPPDPVSPGGSSGGSSGGGSTGGGGDGGTGGSGGTCAIVQTPVLLLRVGPFGDTLFAEAPAEVSPPSRSKPIIMTC